MIFPLHDCGIDILDETELYHDYEGNLFISYTTYGTTSDLVEACYENEELDIENDSFELLSLDIRIDLDARYIPKIIYNNWSVVPYVEMKEIKNDGLTLIWVNVKGSFNAKTQRCDIIRKFVTVPNYRAAWVKYVDNLMQLNAEMFKCYISKRPNFIDILLSMLDIQFNDPDDDSDGSQSGVNLKMFSIIFSIPLPNLTC